MKQDRRLFESLQFSFRLVLVIALVICAPRPSEPGHCPSWVSSRCAINVVMLVCEARYLLFCKRHQVHCLILAQIHMAFLRHITRKLTRRVPWHRRVRQLIHGNTTMECSLPCRRPISQHLCHTN